VKTHTSMPSEEIYPKLIHERGDEGDNMVLVESLRQVLYPILIVASSSYHNFVQLIASSSY
jgi:hypothetical protein